MEKVVVQVENDSEYVDVTIHWQGGFTSRHEVVRPVRSYEQLRDLDKLMDRIAALRDEGYTTAQIAECLNQEGFSPPKRRGGFFPDLVRQLLVRRGLANEKTYAEQLGPHEWWLPKLAEAIPVIRREARRLGAPGVGPLPEDARAASLDSLGRQAGVDATPQAGGLVSSWHREVSGRTHYSEAARTWLTARPSTAEVRSCPRQVQEAASALEDQVLR